MGDTTKQGMQEAGTQEEFRARMEAQRSKIEQYRRAVQENEGRTLSQDEAGLEWVERYAESFARCHDSS